MKGYVEEIVESHDKLLKKVRLLIIEKILLQALRVNRSRMVELELVEYVMQRRKGLDWDKIEWMNEMLRKRWIGGERI
jgi:hypothetical protein